MKKFTSGMYGIIPIGTALILFFIVREYAPHQVPGWEGYADIHRHSPMIALPGASPSLVKEAAEELKKSASVSIVAFSDDKSRTWNKDVYPVEFLKAAAEAEEMRRLLVREGTKENGLRYHTKFIWLLDEYESALNHTLSGLGVGKPTTIASFKGTTSSAYIADVLRYGKKNLGLMRDEENRRFLCAEGSTYECLRDPHWPIHTSAQGVALFGTHPQTIPEETIQLREALRTYARELYQLDDITTVQLSSSSCYPSYAPIYYDVSTRTSLLSPVTTGQFTLLSDAFFYDLAKIPVNFSREYLRAGVTYSYQPFNAYICQDSGREMGDLLGVRHAWLELGETPIESSGVTAGALHKLQEAQRDFTAHEPAQQSYLRVVSAINRTLARGDDYALRLFGTRDAVETLRDLSLEARTRSAQFELIVGYFDDLQGGTYATGVLDAYRASVFYMLRSGISPLLLLQNETGPFADKGSLFQTSAREELPPTGYTLYSYERKLKAHFSIEQLLETHLKGHYGVFKPLLIKLKNLRGNSAAAH